MKEITEYLGALQDETLQSGEPVPSDTAALSELCVVYFGPRQIFRLFIFSLRLWRHKLYTPIERTLLLAKCRENSRKKSRKVF